jgi:hypothetical protein
MKDDDMDEPRIYAADEHARRLTAAVLRELAAGAGDASSSRRVMIRPAAPGAVRRGRQLVPRPPVRRRRA